MQLVDTHVHLNFDSFQPDLEQVAQNWRNVGVTRLVHSCVEPGEFEAIRGIADRFPEVSFAVGLHPLDMDRWSPPVAAHIRTLAQSDPRIVAIGETGLDFYKSSDRHEQEAAFVAQLAIAQDLGLPVIIHCREAALEMVHLLRQFWATHGAVAGVMHCWAGNPEQAEAFLDLGFYISFSGIVTFKNAIAVQESARMVPADRLLIETDCPFLAPVPKRGQKRNEPSYVQYVAEQVARLRGVPVEAIAQQTTENAFKLFKLT